jgi:opacity protein-like surface antigen
MKPFALLLISASSLFSLWIGSPAQANSTPEFTDRSAKADATQTRGVPGGKSQIALNQSAADLERQRAAEQAVKDAERIRQENRNTASPRDPSYYERQRLQEQTDRGVERVRENVQNPARLQQSQAELDRLRRERQNINSRYNYYPYYNGSEWGLPLYPSAESIIEQPQVYPSTETTSPSPGYSSGYGPGQNTRERGGTISLSTGFKDGTVNPAIGYRLPNSNIGFELGAVFNQDALPPGNVNEYPAGSLLQQFPNGFNNLGVKTTTPNIGGDIIGYYDVSPQVTLHGGVGIYFQSRSQITQSKATADLFKETNETTTSFALSGGADFRVGDAVRIGAGYHSLRGVTAKIGIEF